MDFSNNFNNVFSTNTAIFFKSAFLLGVLKTTIKLKEVDVNHLLFRP
jgi:hypothetical protein